METSSALWLSNVVLFWKFPRPRAPSPQVACCAWAPTCPARTWSHLCPCVTETPCPQPSAARRPGRGSKRLPTQSSCPLRHCCYCPHFSTRKRRGSGTLRKVTEFTVGFRPGQAVGPQRQAPGDGGRSPGRCLFCKLRSCSAHFSESCILHVTTCHRNPSNSTQAF